MAIERNAASSSNISQPGEYKVTIVEAKSGLSKSKIVTGVEKGKRPMLTVVFQTKDELSINSYFVKDLKFAMKALENLKVACGLKVTDSADNLIGKQCGVLVEAGKPQENGKVFMQIVGYGPAEKASDFATSESNVPEDAIPF